jgi:hypothetical protein
MSPELEYIELIFENCDSVRIPSSYVLGMSFEKITNYLWANFSHQLIEENVCQKFEIDLDNSALNYQTYFQETVADGKDDFKYHLEIAKDITHINIKPNNREAIYIALPWKSGKQETENLYQKTIFQEDSFIISCEEGKEE